VAPRGRRALGPSMSGSVTDVTHCRFDFFVLLCLSIDMRLTEAQSSSTLVLQSGAQLQLHCAGEAQSRPVWYYNNEQLAEVSQTSITVAVNTATNTRQSVLTRTSDGIDGQYQCRDGNGYQANSDVLLVMYASN